MMRKQEIQEAMKESISETIYASGYGITLQATDLLECAFIKGAEFADRTMLDKAARWLEENIDLYAMDTISAKSGYHQIVLTREFEEAFRQAMKGE